MNRLLPAPTAARPLRPGRRLACAVAVAGIALLAFSGPSRAATTALGVSATILPRTEVETTAAPATLQVSAQDIARGWIDLPQAVRLTVRSNLPHGPTLLIATTGDLVSSGSVGGLAEAVSFGPGQGALPLPAHRPSERAQYALSLHLQLADGVTPGEYPFPVRFYGPGEGTVLP